MNVVITGTSGGIGKAAAELFLQQGHKVSGIDIKEASIVHDLYKHFVADISKAETLPQICNVEILINNAGVQTAGEQDINVNLLGTMNVTKKYAFQKAIKSVLFNASVSALTGNEFPEYVASKAGVVGYMKYCAIRLSNEYKATCNALCFGGVLTELNNVVTENPLLWKKVMDVTPLKKWLDVKEAAQWCLFLTTVNTFCTGQAIDVSGGERNCANLFVWDV